VSDKEIAYDIRLEKILDEVKLKIWLSEELQIQPEQYHGKIIQNYFELTNQA